MRHETVLQRADGCWDYVSAHPRRGTYAIGYCSRIAPCEGPGPHSELLVTGANGDSGSCPGCDGSGYRRKPIEECCHHETKDEAFAHYRQYVLDNLREGVSSEEILHRCKVPGCKEYTNWLLQEPDGYHSEYLCDAHRNRETYAELFYPEGQKREAWAS